MNFIAVIPSPETSVWWLGPLPLRGYALCILAGILIGLWMTSQRMRARGGTGGEIYEIALPVILAGIVGGRLYHVLITAPGSYFGDGNNPVDALKIWEGGLGIFGAVAVGGLAAWFFARRHGYNAWDMADAIMPGLLVAQGVGRWGNWFNNELYGAPSTAPWAVQIHQMSGGEAVRGADGAAVVLGSFQPAFLYESLWNLTAAVALLLLDRRLRLARGQMIGLYLMAYGAGRIITELMRTEPAQELLGMRIHFWVALTAIVAGLVIVAWRGRTGDRAQSVRQ